MNESHLIATRLACWTTSPAMEGHFLLPLLKDAKAHIEMQERRVSDMQREMLRMADQLGKVIGTELRRAYYEGEG